MAAARFYSSTAGAMKLQADITASATILQVDTTTGLPGTTPFTIVIDPGNGEEILDVTSVSGTTLTVTRGIDGTSPQSHAAGADIRHMATARDFREPQEHIGSTVAHGTTGNVVGTDSAQTLKNKNLSDASNTFPSSLATDAELAAHAAATATHGATGAIVGTTNAQALTNKDLTSGTNTFPASLATDAELSAHATATTGVHGVGAGAVVGTSATQTLTNKTISGSNNTLSNIPQAAVTNLGIWIAYTPTVRTDTGSSAAPGTSVQVARYMQIGNTVWAYGEATASSLVSNCSVLLPTAPGVPARRYLNCGTMVITDGAGAANPAQLSIARMTTGLDRVLTITDTNAFCDAPAGSTIQWNLCYEVA
jgi:hypothetical protein